MDDFTSVCERCGAPLESGPGLCSSCAEADSGGSSSEGGEGASAGESFSGSEDRSNAVSSESSDFCGNCGTPLAPGETFCTSCGTAMPEKPKPAFTSWLRYTLISVLVIVLLGGGISLLGTFWKGRTKPPGGVAALLDDQRKPLNIEIGKVLESREISSRDGGNISTPDGLTFIAPPGSLDRDRKIEIHEAKVPDPGISVRIPGDSKKTQMKCLKAWHIDPGKEERPFNDCVELTVTLPELKDKKGVPPAVMALISHDGKSWSYIPCDVKDGRITVKTRSLSTFAVFGCHPAYPVLLGITVISALSYYVYKNLDQEIPQRFHAQAPFVALLNPLEVPGAGTGHLYFAWSKSLGSDKDTGAKDEKAFLNEAVVIVERYRKMSNPPTPKDQSLPFPYRQHAINEIYLAGRKYLVPDSVLRIEKAVFLARDYYSSRKGFRPLSSDVWIYVVSTDEDFYQNPWLQRGYLMLSTKNNDEKTNVCALHELFHRFQNEYYTFGGDLPTLEASAMMIEREARAYYEQNKKPFWTAAGQTEAQFVAYRMGLDGPGQSVFSNNPQPPRYLGYGLSWFLEYLKIQAIKTSKTLNADNFHGNFLEKWSQSDLHQALQWASGGSDETLARAYLNFAAECVFDCTPSKLGKDSYFGKLYESEPLSYDPSNDYMEARGEEPGLGIPSTTYDLGRNPYLELGDAEIPCWSIQFCRLNAPDRPNAQLVVQVPGCWLRSCQGRSVIYRKGDEKAVIPLAIPEALTKDDPVPPDENSTLSQLVPVLRGASNYLYMVDTGIVRGTKPARVYLLEPPSNVKAAVAGDKLSISWDRPDLAVKNPACVKGYTVYLNGKKIADLAPEGKGSSRELPMPEGETGQLIIEMAAMDTSEPPLESARSQAVTVNRPGSPPSSSGDAQYVWILTRQWTDDNTGKLNKTVTRYGNGGAKVGDGSATSFSDCESGTDASGYDTYAATLAPGARVKWKKHARFTHSWDNPGREMAFDSENSITLSVADSGSTGWPDTDFLYGTTGMNVYCCGDLTSDFNKGVLVDQSGVTAGLSTGNSGDYGRRSNSKKVRWTAGPKNMADPYISDLPESYKRLVVAVSVSANGYPNTSENGWGAIYYEYVLKKK